MAEKHRRGTVEAVSCTKLPRLEAEPSHTLSVGLCKSTGLPSHPSETHYSYKGSYFTYPPQSHERHNPLAHWTSAEAYAPCMGGTASPRLGAERARCMFYREDSENFGRWGPTAGHEREKDCLARGALTAQEKWASYPGHSDFIQQSWFHGLSAQHSARVPPVCPTLAAPKPVYRNHVYCIDPGYGHKGPVALGMPVESTIKQPLETEWPPPPSGHQFHTDSQCYGTAVPKKVQGVDSSFLQLNQIPKDTVPPTLTGFSPYHKTLEKLRGTPSTSFLEANSPAPCASQKHLPEGQGISPSKNTWSKLPPPPGLLPDPQMLSYSDRSATCYSLPSYALAPHEQVPLYHPSFAQADKSSSLFPLPACKSFSFPRSEEPQALPRAYFPSSPRSYYPTHLDSYLCRTVGPPPVSLPGPQASRQHELQQNSGSKLDFMHQAPPSACTLPLKSPSYGRDGIHDLQEGSRVSKSINEDFLNKPAAIQPHAFEPLHSVDRWPNCFAGQMREAGYGADLCQSQKTTAVERLPSGGQVQPTVTSEVKTNNVRAQPDVGACIVIPDSPITSHNTFPKEYPGKTVPERPISSFQNMLQTHEEKSKGFQAPSSYLPPSSPPMPVINNVFSLAPYQEYLKGPAGPGKGPLSKGCQVDESSIDNTHTGRENKSCPWPSSVGLSEPSGLLPLRGKEPASSVITGFGQTDVTSNCVMTQARNQDTAGSYKGKPWPVAHGLDLTDWVDDGVGELAKDDHVLDLSLKAEGVVEMPTLGTPLRKMETLEGERSKIKGGEAKETPGERLEGLQETKLQSLQLPVPSGSGEKSNFHSSAAFLFKKFKILKSHAGCAVQSSPSPLQSSSPIAALPTTLSLGQQATEQAAAIQQGSQQQLTRLISLPDQQSPQPMVMHFGAPPLQQKCLRVDSPAASTPLPSHVPADSPALGEDSVLLPTTCNSQPQQSSPRQYFTALHTSICNLISDSVSTSSPELLKEWMKKAESDRELKGKAVGSAKPKSGSKFTEGPKLSKGKEIWLAFQDMTVLLRKLLSQLETFLLTHKCPFPHVVRAGTVFIPIHVVKETLFTNLSGTSVDHVLQDHKVELRPTTLSEEKLLRDLELQSCTSRMLKLLALKQLPKIYPDLLSLHWRDCVQQQLGKCG